MSPRVLIPHKYKYRLDNDNHLNGYILIVPYTTLHFSLVNLNIHRSTHLEIFVPTYSFQSSMNTVS